MKLYKHIAEKCNNWVRVEAQYSGEYAHQLTEHFKSVFSEKELKDLILASILDRYMLFYKKSNTPIKLSKLMIQELENDNYKLESLSHKNNSLERSIKYLINNSGLFSIYFKIESIWGVEGLKEFTKYLNEKYRYYLPNNDVFVWLNKNKKSYFLQEKPWKEE